MKLYVDGWRARDWTGVARYLTSIIRHWDREALSSAFDEAFLCTPTPLPDLEKTLPDAIRPKVVRPDARMLVWQSIALGRVATSGVLWCPSYTRPVFCGARVVVTTHDATHALFPELYPSVDRFYTRWYGWSARHAKLVITNNELTRRDIVRAYRLPEEKIRVVPLAPAEHFAPVDDKRALREARVRLVGADVPFFLNVGKLSRRRNVPKLIQGFGELKRRSRSPYRLVLVGKNTQGLDISAEAASAGVPDDVVHLPYVSDADLNVLYNCCDVFVLVATYEANSLTAIEAQAAGAPTLVADSPGMREMTGGKAELLERVDPVLIADALHALASDPGRRSAVAAGGLAHARRFSWKRTAKETLAVLAEASRR